MLRFPEKNSGLHEFQQMDILVPCSGNDSGLLAFAAILGRSYRQFVIGGYGAGKKIRLLISRFSEDRRNDGMGEDRFRQRISASTLLAGHDAVEFVNVESSSYNRGMALSALRQKACQSDDCLLAVVDVGVHIYPGFLRNCFTFVYPGESTYFPIFWSDFNPDSVSLVEAFYGKKQNPIHRFSPHRVSSTSFSA